jgi:lipoprotein-releasing system permease protein
MRLRFELGLAVRHLISGGWQSVGVCGGVAVAVLLVILVPSIGTGMERHLGRTLSETLAAVTIKPGEREPVALAPASLGLAEDTLVSADFDDHLTQRRLLEGWAGMVETLRRDPEVAAAAPSVTGPVLVSCHALTRAAALVGADPPGQDAVTPVAANLVHGRYLDLGEDEVVMGWSLARELRAGVGERVRILSDEGGAGAFRVAGLFDSGDDAADRGRIFVTLRAGQGLLRTGRHVTGISLRLRDSYRANDFADRIEPLLHCDTDTWMRQNSGTLALLSVQGLASAIISAFTMLSAALGIASILSISVLQKSKQIGILKSIGARRRQILAVFALEGLIVGAVGSAAGAALAVGLIRLLGTLHAAPRPSGKPGDVLVPLALDPELVLRAVLLAVTATLLASLAPARRAARMDPVEVIRAG